MKKLIVISLVVALFNTQFVTSAYAFGGIGQIFRNIVRVLKSGGDDIMKVFRKSDDVNTIRNVGKSSEEIAASKTLGEDAELLAIVGKKNHSADFSLLKKNKRSSYSRLKNIDDIPFDDIAQELLDWDSKSPNTKSNFYKYIVINWLGKVYRNSDYYSKPELEEKMLLVCKTEKEVFYFSLFMEQEPRRAFLINHISNENGSILPNQELVVLEDTKKEKLMSTMPEKSNKYPSHYFFILKENQGFIYKRNYKGTTLPDSMKFQAIYYIVPEKNRCFKGTEEGLYR